MSRVRISTTVDAERLERCRRLCDEPTSGLIDRALRALAQELEHAQELAALQRFPYEDDPELAWEAPRGPDLAYDGDIPDEVQELAARRRRPATP